MKNKSILILVAMLMLPVAGGSDRNNISSDSKNPVLLLSVTPNIFAAEFYMEEGPCNSLNPGWGAQITLDRVWSALEY